MREGPEATGRERPRLGEALLDLVVPQQCGGCGRAGTCWCSDCAAAVRGSVRRLELEVPGAAAGEHAGPLGHAVVAFKDRGLHRLSGPLGQALAESAAHALGQLGHHGPVDRAAPVWLVPVPSRAESKRRRGSDHMSVLAARAARELRRSGWPAHRCRVLLHAHASRDQVGLDAGQRRANLAGTLRASAAPPGILVVVDDVTTTGATLAEAVRALRAARDRSPQAREPATRWPILAATITVATLVRGQC